MRVSSVVLVLVLIGCGGGGGDNAYPTGTNANPGPPSGTGTNPTTSASVAMKQSDDGYGTAVFSFSPGSVTIVRGGTVTWTNEGGSVAHNVTFSGPAGAPSDIGNFTSGTASRTFGTAGSYAYQCTNHPGMNGTVTVQ